MLDAPARRGLAPVLDRTAAALHDSGVPDVAVTGVGWVLGLAACVSAATEHWTWGLVLWLANRLADGLDGPVARRSGASDLGGFLDLLADFSIYAGFVLAVGIAVPEARVACLALLVTYYLSGAAFLLLAPHLQARGARGDGRSLFFVGGLADGTETVVAYVALCLAPAHAAIILWVFAAMVGLTAIQRTALGIRTLRSPHPRRPRTTTDTPSPDPQELG